MAGPSRVTLYERDGCHLCEETRVLLDEMLGQDGYTRVDIGADDELVLRYGFRIPVIAVDGTDRLEAPITPEDLTTLLAR
jgi:glutaredoxin